MKVENLTMFGAVSAAFAASLCCILPLVFVVLGVGAVGAAAFETARPFLLGAAALLLAFGFYRAYFRREESCAPGEKCGAKPINRASRISLWLALIAVVAFALAPYYTGIIARNLMTPNTQASAVTADAPATIAQAKFKITGMTCGGCANTIEVALEKTAGVRRAEVSYERGEAIVDYDLKVITPEKIRDVINQTGFKAEIINNNSENQSTTKYGGQLTVINGSENSVVLVSSTRFRCAFCVTRVVDALKAQNGVEDVGFDKDVQPLALRVRFDPQKVNPKIIGESAKQALETDPYNTAPVEVIYK